MRARFDSLPLWSRAGAITGLNLSGGMLLSFMSGFAVSEVPLHLPRISESLLGAVVAISVLYLAGVRWSRQLLRTAGFSPDKRIARVGGLSFAGAIVAAGLSLAGLEGLVVGLRQGPQLPIHVLFGVLFVPATLIVVAVVSMVLGTVIRDARLGFSMARRSAPLAALGFLLVDIGMDSLGRRVGAPGAEAKATMLTVMMLGGLAASLIGGAALGTGLARIAKREEPHPVEFSEGELGFSDG